MTMAARLMAIAIGSDDRSLAGTASMERAGIDGAGVVRAEAGDEDEDATVRGGVLCESGAEAAFGDGATVFGGDGAALGRDATAVAGGAAEALGGGAGEGAGAAGGGGVWLNGTPRAAQNCSRFSRLVARNGSLAGRLAVAIA
jgi:hypothetical protein